MIVLRFLRYILPVAAAVCLVACTAFRDSSAGIDNSFVPVATPPPARVMPDQTPPFSVEPDQPFQLGLGRGTRQQGLQTILIRQDGSVVLYRLHQKTGMGIKRTFWGKGVMTLSRDSIAKLCAALAENNLMRMPACYVAERADSVQWIFFVTRNGREKAVYCDGHVPEHMQRFAALLDAVLAEEGIQKVPWELVPEAYADYHDDLFWEIARAASTPPPDRRVLP